MRIMYFLSLLLYIHRHTNYHYYSINYYYCYIMYNSLIKSIDLINYGIFDETLTVITNQG